MTLEEKAEEYLQSIEGDDCVILIAREERKQAYIAGAKENGVVWHNLKENPEDLPKEFDINKNRWELEKRITKHIVQNEYGERVFCFNGTWYHEKGGEAYPVAWCEIPQFQGVVE